MSNSISAKVELWVGNEAPIAHMSVANVEPFEAAAVALRQFRRLGHPVFADGAFVTINRAADKPLKMKVWDVVAWLKRPEQADVVQRLDELDMQRELSANS
jgi:hypothetical protein